ncbi:MAG: HlyD family efflux transporter periplasmic adaptor subunit [Chloroflexi bacterium]|nr:HlyD family efflux transporter periplasmic adaptor subunit [Chloroflexota bacterium]
MPANQPVYRKAALDKLASPEELDQLMQITRPGAWLLLAAFGVVLLIALSWSIFGRITTTLDQSGTLTLRNPVVFVPAPQAGQIVEISAQPGSLIAAERPIARVSTATGTVSITSPVNGRVISVRVQIGEPVDAGTPLISVESFDRPTQQQEIVTYVPLGDRQQIRVGMDVQILPSNVELEKYGYLEGRVQSVARFAATQDEIRAVLGEVNSVNDPSAGGAVFEVRIALTTNRAGHYIWSASDGPSTPIVSGTPCLIKIQVENQRPIEKIFNLVS